MGVSLCLYELHNITANINMFGITFNGGLTKWLEDGKLKVVEDYTDGLENAYDAFLTLFHDVQGEKSNLGKKIVRIAEPPLPIAN